MPATMKLKNLLGGRQALAGVLLPIVTLAALIVPAIIVTESLVETARSLAAAIDRGDLQIPSPPPEVAEWPFIGKPVSEAWMLASTNIEAAFRKLEPQLTTAGSWLLGQVASSFVGIVMFVVSILIAGLFMVKADLAVAATKKMATRDRRRSGPRMGGPQRGYRAQCCPGACSALPLFRPSSRHSGLFLMDIPGRRILERADSIAGDHAIAPVPGAGADHRVRFFLCRDDTGRDLYRLEPDRELSAIRC